MANRQGNRLKVILKELKCIKCGSIMPIWRKKSKNRNTGHIKHIWCYKCQKVSAHKEI